MSDEAAGAGILAMYSEYRQRSPARKDPFYGDRIPILPALKREASLFFADQPSSAPTMTEKSASSSSEGMRRKVMELPSSSI